MTPFVLLFTIPLAAIGSLLAGRVIKVIGTKMSDEIWTEIKLKVSSMVAEDIRH